jgi:metallo-beta-lactamase family protein
MFWSKDKNKKMDIKLKFLGAVQNVTGSRHLLEVDGTRVLVDCGLYQERHLIDRNWDPFPVEAKSIDAVLLTHAHLDHCGYLPKLVKEGFAGKIYCTDATAEIAKIILLDSAHIQEEDAEFKKKRHAKEGRESPRPVVPLYTTEEAESTFPLFSPVEYKSCVKISDSVEACLYDAGHVLGSSIIKITATQDGEERVILYTGDIGRPDKPIVCDPATFERADYIVIESTYGDRVHEPTEDIESKMADVIVSTYEKGGKIVIPSFALERSQEVLYYLNNLILTNKIPKLKVYLDSPMAAKITKVFKKHPDMFDKKMREFILNHESPLDFPLLNIVESTEQSKELNDKHEPMIIIAGSGMCTGGRVKHHLVNYISDSRNTIMFVGYQAVGTPGRSIVDGINKVRILGTKRDIKADIVRIHGFSSHADKVELIGWLKKLKTCPKGIFVVHGEENSSKALAEEINSTMKCKAIVPEYEQEVTLE